jgi:hypothetical protein
MRANLTPKDNSDSFCWSRLVDSCLRHVVAYRASTITWKQVGMVHTILPGPSRLYECGMWRPGGTSGVGWTVSLCCWSVLYHD